MKEENSASDLKDSQQQQAERNDEDEMEIFVHEKPLEWRLMLFRGSGNFIGTWEKFIIILALYNSIMIPWQLFYDELGLKMFRGDMIVIIDSVID